MDETRAAQFLESLKGNLSKVIVGKGWAIDMLLTALICGGHVLIEDLPGLGKTTLAAALAQSLSCTFKRIQFTPDVLPSDVTGFTTYNLGTGEKEVRFGAVMAQMVLADEINRTSPKTQSSLLEVMQEHQVTIDGVTYKLPEPFMVLATQNPSELTGTYPLPEAQLDRFLIKVNMGYPTREEEYNILSRHKQAAAGEGVTVKELEPVGTAEDVLALRQAYQKVKCSEAIINYIVQISQRSRSNEQIALGVSPRGSIALMEASMARALLKGRSYVIPDDVKEMAGPVLGHRVRLNLQASMKNRTAQEMIQDVVSSVEVPGVSGGF